MYHRTYYYNGNCVYVMLKNGESFTFPSVNESCLRFSSDEEVTYMGISQTRQGSQVTAEDLLVGDSQQVLRTWQRIHLQHG